MNIITIPDLHGKDVWNKIQFDKYSKIIFLGDYVDSKTHIGFEVVENLKNIIALKLALPQKIVLLLGNHDMQYMYYPRFQCSGMDYGVQQKLTAIFNDNKSLFQFAYHHGSKLWTHAGVSNGWFLNNLALLQNFVEHNIYEELGSALNKLGLEDPRPLAEISSLRGGDLEYGGILWADMQETRKDFLKNYHQYVGHTKVPSIIKYGDDNTSITYLDCLNTIEEYLTVNVDNE